MPGPVAVPVALELVRELSRELDDPSRAMEPEELRTWLRRLQRAQRDAPAECLAPLFDAIGRVCHHLRDYRRALDAHRNAANYDKRNAGCLNNVAAVLIDLNQPEQALAVLRDAETLPVKPTGVEICILTNTAEIHHRLGNHDAAREAFARAVRSVDPAAPMDFMRVAGCAAVLGRDDDAVEFCARALASAKGVDLGETPAIDFVRSDPEHMRAASVRGTELGAAIERVAARYDDPPPPEHQLISQITLPPAAATAFLDAVEHAREPGDTLRALFHEHRA